jgi:predicted ATPase
MLTRLKVSGFKNLVDVDIRFGPFTCIAGANAVGKSNLFDAIQFLSALADKPLVDAALSIRNEEARTGDIRSLFHRVGEKYDDEMSFTAEMIIPQEGVDDLGQPAKAARTFLRYSLDLRYRPDTVNKTEHLEIRKEELVHIGVAEAKNALLFSLNSAWKNSVLSSGARTSPFISTDSTDRDKNVIKLHQDGGPGRVLSLAASKLPRTVLSTTNAVENRTALLARREMQSWRLLQLEPSALRKPDNFTDPRHLASNGAHLAATLYRLIQSANRGNSVQPAAESGVPDPCGYLAGRLHDLIQDVQEIQVDRDEKRELFTLYIKGKDQTPHQARLLSDGTLRFLALGVIEIDPEAQGVLCLEEPENGIHPQRIPAMLKLLQDIAVDPTKPVGPDNPLRQVIINTHAPAVVAQVPDDALIVAELREDVRDEMRFKKAAFGCLPDTWRTKKLRDGAPSTQHVIARGDLLAYLDPIPKPETTDADDESPSLKPNSTTDATKKRSRRVIDRPDIQPLLFSFENDAQ